MKLKVNRFHPIKGCYDEWEASDFRSCPGRYLVLKRSGKGLSRIILGVLWASFHRFATLTNGYKGRVQMDRKLELESKRRDGVLTRKEWIELQLLRQPSVNREE